MLFRAEDLNTGLLEANNILSEAAYIGSPIMALNTVSVVEDTTLGKGVVRFADIEALSEETGADYLDIISALSESNGLHPEDLVVAVDEADIILDPSIVTELANVVVNPISENSLAYQFCETCIDAWLEDGAYDDTCLLAIVDEGVLFEAGQTGTQHAAELGHSINQAVGSGIDRLKDMFWNATGNKKGSRYQNAASDLEGYHQARQQFDAESEKEIRRINNGHFSQNDKNTLFDNLKQRLGLAGSALDAQGSKASSTLRSVENRAKNWQTIKDNKGKIAAGIAGAALLGYGAKKLYDSRKAKAAGIDAAKVMKEADKNGPRWISRKIASLRNMYAQWLQKAKAESDSGKANIFKQIAAKIMSVIDALMKKLQSMTA